jgi:hypothetical protein
MKATAWALMSILAFTPALLRAEEPVNQAAEATKSAEAAKESAGQAAAVKS